MISPDEINHNIRTVIIAPMTTRGRACPTRVARRFQNKEGQIVLDQIRTVDKIRLVKRISRVDEDVQQQVLNALQALFSV